MNWLYFLRLQFGNRNKRPVNSFANKNEWLRNKPKIACPGKAAILKPKSLLAVGKQQ